jgi:glutamine amidotransferase
MRFPEPLASPAEGSLKIPHMGWNGIVLKRDHPVLEGITPADEFYFVHSYYPFPEEKERVIAATDYGITFPSVIAFRNLIAMQFHPEKSGPAGLRILQNFCAWDGRHAE